MQSIPENCCQRIKFKAYTRFLQMHISLNIKEKKLESFLQKSLPLKISMDLQYSDSLFSSSFFLFLSGTTIKMRMRELLNAKHDKQPSGQPSSHSYPLTPPQNSFQVDKGSPFSKEAFWHQSRPSYCRLGVIIHSDLDSITRNHRGL